ncbi:hypothetical protein OEZ85_007404 [Tetradesmus obliquus]|uniref:Mitochondrial proton/calcium exchanger protein n=2 Tax=Tetradesmus obliquus TaxID=3088 RepID=A0ABY8THY3_TETOB|nr:hypothetical protein OEZ85_007404 [Tetradesmus obliquus]
MRLLQSGLPASQQLLAALGGDAHSSSSNSWWQQHLSQQQLQALRQLASQAGQDKKEEQPKKDAPSSPVELPDAEDCDEAIEHYARARSSYQRLTPPSTYKTASQRVVDIITAGLKGTVMVLGWVVQLPVKLARLATWSREDWSGWWAKAKKTVKDEAHHYWVGFKLLAFDVRVASGLAFKAMRGNTLTRRERRQLTRTTADMFRLVPMVIILLVPFLELLLPLLLKLFPNMLPSTFEDKLKKEEEVKKRLVVKMEVAKFLQDTVAEMAKDIKAKRTGEMSTNAAELYAFINRVRAGGEVSNDELVRFASLFNDELTLDNLDRVQLVSMCQLLSIPPFGTDGFLRNRLRSQLASIKQDDLLIRSEGLDSLTDDELRSASKARGMKAAFGEGGRAYMTRQMQNWLDLSLNRGMPSSLLLLSRAFTLTSPVPSAAPGAPGASDDLGRVKETLLTLPQEVIQDVGLEVAAATSGAEELQKRLALMQKEQKLIQEEAQAAVLEAAAAAPAVMAGAHVGGAADGGAAAAAAGAGAGKERVLEAEPRPAGAAAAAGGASGEAAAQHAAAVAAATAVLNEASASALRDVIAREGISEAQREACMAQAREQRMQELLKAITVLASNSGVATERVQFMDLVRQQISQLQDTHGTASPSLTFTAGGLTAVRPEENTELAHELVAPRRLEERVNGILLRLEKELDQAEEAIGERLHVLDLDNDGLISAAELSDALRFLRANLDEQDLVALLDRLEIKGSGGADQPTIPVAELIKLAEPAAAAKVAAEVKA